MENLLLSVIIPVYNVEKYLTRCLDSVLDQELDLTQYEIILVNDGSKDNSLALAKEYQSKYANITIISQENQGSSVARNTGRTVAKGQYLYFMDSDDYVERKVFKKLLGIGQQHNLDLIGFDAIGTALSDYKVDLDFEYYTTPSDNLKIYNGVSLISNHNFNNGTWWYFIKREVLEQSGIYFEKGIMIEDGIFTAELLLHCKRATFMKLNIYRYFKNPNSTTTRKTREHILKMIDNFKFVILKYNSILQKANHFGADEKAILRIKTRQESYLFFLFVRLIKANAKFHEFIEVINIMKANKIYPMKHFIGVDYNSRKEKGLTYIFNHKILLYGLLQANKVLKLIK